VTRLIFLAVLWQASLNFRVFRAENGFTLSHTFVASTVADKFSVFGKYLRMDELYV